jgi:hypothetical protein
LTTYQRNIQLPSEDEFDDFLSDEVGGAKVQTCDGDEAEHDGGRLRDLAAIWPLDALQLSPARADEGECTIATRGERRSGWALARAFASAPTVTCDAVVAPAIAGSVAGVEEIVARSLVAVAGLGARLDVELLIERDGWTLDGLREGRDTACAADERGVELVDVC